MENQIIALITQVTFPIFVCVWFLTKTEGVLNNLTKEIMKLSQIIKDLHLHIKGGFNV